MEILPKPSFADILHYGIAYSLAILSSAMAAVAVAQLRVLALIFAGLADYDFAGVRLVSVLSLIILGVAWAVYVLAVVPVCVGSITQVRMLRAQGRPSPYAGARQSFLRWLASHDLDLLAVRFFRLFLIPLILFVVVFLLKEVIV